MDHLYWSFERLAKYAWMLGKWLQLMQVVLYSLHQPCASKVVGRSVESGLQSSDWSSFNLLHITEKFIEYIPENGHTPKPKPVKPATPSPAKRKLPAEEHGAKKVCCIFKQTEMCGVVFFPMPHTACTLPRIFHSPAELYSGRLLWSIAG